MLLLTLTLILTLML